MISFPNNWIAAYNPVGSDALREESMVDLIDIPRLPTISER
jgi:hypothetical protein